MDLFDDLPEPATSTESSNGNKTGVHVGHSVHAPMTSVDNRKEDQHKETLCGEKRKLEEDSNSNVSPEKKLAVGYSHLHGYSAERKGEREDMQDAHVLLPDYLNLISQPHPSIKRLSYYAVFDGHGGARAAKNAAENLHLNLAQKFPKGNQNQAEKDMKKCFVEAFKKTDEDFLKKASKSKPSWKDGSTAVCLLALNDTLFVANLGDSKAVLCRYSESLGKCVAVALTKDHSPSIYEERIRIQKRGGHVKDGRVMGILEVSRSLGDGPYKNHGVTCLPDVKRCQLTNTDRFLLIACDGLWKQFSNETAIEFVNSILEDESIQGTESRSAIQVRYDTACNRLANEAVRRLSADNVTVLLVAIDNTS